MKLASCLSGPLLTVFTIFNIVVYAQQPVTPRSNTKCGLLLNKIYCFGGNLYKTSTENAPDNVINVLDLTTTTTSSNEDTPSMTTEQLQAWWKPVSADTNGVDIHVRTIPQVIALLDGYRMLINGGFKPNSPSRLANHNIVYDAKDNKWLAYEDYNEPPYGKRQIYYGTVVNVPGKGAAFYGGFEVYINQSWTTPSLNSSIFNFGSDLSRAIGYTQIAYFNIDANPAKWIMPTPVPTTYAPTFFARQEAIFDPVTQLIIYMGGETRSNDMASPSINGVKGSFMNVTAFNTVTNEWSEIQLNGNGPAVGRFFFSLTLTPTTNRDVILYGGEYDGVASNDYCYVLNLDTKNWTRQTIAAPAGTTLARSQHSSVIVKNDTLFVMWGVDGNKAGTSSILLLNISNPHSITYMDKFNLIQLNDNNNSNSSSSNDNNQNNTTTITTDDDGVKDNSLSTGATVGIAVACVAVAIIAAAVIVFYVRKKKKTTTNNNKNQYYDENDSHDINNDNNNNNNIMDEVDWDKIEENYLEMPALPQTNNNHYQASIHSNHHTPISAVPYSENESTTVVSHHSHDNYQYKNNNDNNNTPSVVQPDGVNIYQRPNEYSQVLKPDGGWQ